MCTLSVTGAEGKHSTDSWGWIIVLRSRRFKVRTTRRHCRGLQTVGMGVRRLTAFLEAHRDIYHDALFGNNRLVIDGSDLIEGLYFDSGRDAAASGSLNETRFRPLSSRTVENLERQTTLRVSYQTKKTKQLVVRLFRTQRPTSASRDALGSGKLSRLVCSLEALLWVNSANIRIPNTELLPEVLGAVGLHKNRQTKSAFLRFTLL